MIIPEVKSHTMVREAETNYIFGAVSLSEFTAKVSRKCGVLACACPH